MNIVFTEEAQALLQVSEKSGECHLYPDLSDAATDRNCYCMAGGIFPTTLF